MAKTLIQRSRAKRPSEKAAYHQITGAGKRKVKRQFFGIAPSDESIIFRTLDAALGRNLASRR